MRAKRVEGVSWVQDLLGKGFMFTMTAADKESQPLRTMERLIGSTCDTRDVSCRISAERKSISTDQHIIDM